MVCQDLDKWIAAAWQKVCDFSIRGEGTAMQGEKFVEGKFSHPPHPKDGYALPNCKDPRANRVLEFLISILYPEKPARVTVIVGNTIFVALMEEREVDWALVIRNTVKRLFAAIGQSKPTVICPYVFHLYYAHKTIQPKDKKAYMALSFHRQPSFHPSLTLGYGIDDRIGADGGGFGLPYPKN